MCGQEENAFGILWEKMSDEVFHRLFGSRLFLLNFNLGLAQFRQERGDSPSPRRSIPQWVKRAVYFRENGKCATSVTNLPKSPAVERKQEYQRAESGSSRTYPIQSFPGRS
jgi:hypothetical protein